MSQAMIQTALTARQLVLGSVQQIPEDWFDVQPDAFNHNIRWKAGHMITMMDWFLTNIEGFDYKLPDTYPSLFNFAIVHEGVHLGMISGLAKVILHCLQKGD